MSFLALLVFIFTLFGIIYAFLRNNLINCLIYTTKIIKISMFIEKYSMFSFENIRYTVQYQQGVTHNA